MSLAKAGRKLKRTGKTAVQFKFTSTFEYIDLECIGAWRPENVKVVWQRAHRKAESNNIKWVPVADRGPDGATGRAMFDPTISVALIVTLYRDPKTTAFEEKVYKYYIEHEGAAGKKVLASFHCDVSEYAGIPSTKSALELDCKPVSKKIRKAHIGVTLETEYIKEGVANDADMQSTYSHMTSVGVASVMDDQDSDEDETHPLPILGANPTADEEGSKEQEDTDLSYVPEAMSVSESVKVDNPTTSPAASQPWLPATAKLVNQKGESVPVTELDDKQIIGLYFTAQWCPPCRKFMPKLIKFYKVMKENNCRFHLIYVSSDHTEDDMFEYMQMQKVPFPAISFTSSIGDELRQKYGVHQVPHLVIINRDCKLVDEQARKSVEHAVTNTSAMQCYQDWLEGVAPKQARRTVDSLGKAAKSPKQPSAVASGTSPPPTSPPAVVVTRETERELVQSHGRRTVQSQVSSSPRTKNVTSEELEEKLDRIRELEVTKEALQQTVTDVTEENVKLKARVEELEDRLREVHTVQTNLLRQKKDLADQMNLRGWLMKRGVSGPTGRKWRRRFFRTDQGNQLCYYKGTTGEPQGWIDLLRVQDVRKARSEAQDKTNLTFEVITDGRVYELLAENATDMDKWITAIKSLAEFCQRNAEGGQATSHSS